MYSRDMKWCIFEIVGNSSFNQDTLCRTKSQYLENKSRYNQNYTNYMFKTYETISEGNIYHIG